MIHCHQQHALHRESAGHVSDAYYDYRPLLSPLELMLILPTLKCEIVSSRRAKL